MEDDAEARANDLHSPCPETHADILISRCLQTLRPDRAAEHLDQLWTALSLLMLAKKLEPEFFALLSQCKERLALLKQCCKEIEAQRREYDLATDFLESALSEAEKNSLQPDEIWPHTTLFARLHMLETDM